MSEKSIMFSEVDGVLNMMGKEYINLIPKQLYEIIKNNKDNNYICKYDEKIPLVKQNISKDALSLICLIHYNYWCNDQNEKDKIKKILSHNQNKHNEEKNTKYNFNNGQFNFNNINNKRDATNNNIEISEKSNINNNSHVLEETDNQNLLPIKKEKWYEKIWNKIKKIFKGV